MSSQNSPIQLSAEQLAETRKAQWHQNGEALLTFENLRSWINAAGLVLFTPRGQQLPAPAPSMVEAVLGTSNPAPSVADTEQARSLLARMIVEGAAVPLNLLGTSGEVPDFVVSTAVFQHVFTLRGDKAWKQPPATSGTLKVSPLSLATYNLLSERVTMSAYDLTTQLGKEVTEVAVLRALNELWARLRVLPVPQNDGSPTLWELTSGRFTKQIKAGANAGQPTALSALTTLYLGQALVATEEEIEVFLSPLAARSRIRDVVHALLAARELETFVIEGKTLLHVSGDAPKALAVQAAGEEGTELIAVSDAADGGETGERIKKFVPKPRKTGTGFLAKPGRTFEGRGGSGGARERRPFQRNAAPDFAKPWEEEKASRIARAARPSSVPGLDGEDRTQQLTGTPAEQQERRPYAKKPSFDRGAKGPFGAKPAFGGRSSSSDRPRGSSDRGSSDRSSSDRRESGKAGFGERRAGSGDRPAFGGKGGGRPPRREFEDRPSTRGSAEGRPSRREFAPGGETRSFDRPRAPRKDFIERARPGSESSGGSKRRPRVRSFGEGPPARSLGKKPFGAGERSFGAKAGFSRDRGAGEGGAARGGRASGPPFRKFDAPRGTRPFSGDRGPRTFSDEGGRPERTGRARTEGGRPGVGGIEGNKKPFGRASTKPGGGFAAGREGSKRPFGGAKGGTKGKAFAGKPGSPFEKFVGNKRPFGKRTPARKIKPEKSDSAE